MAQPQHTSITNQRPEFGVVLYAGLLFVGLAWADWKGITWLYSLINGIALVSLGAAMLWAMYVFSAPRLVWLHAIVAVSLVALTYAIPNGLSSVMLGMPWVTRWESFLAIASAYAPPVVATTAGVGFTLHAVAHEQSSDRRLTTAILACQAISLAFLMLRYAVMS